MKLIGSTNDVHVIKEVENDGWGCPIESQNVTRMYANVVAGRLVIT